MDTERLAAIVAAVAVFVAVVAPTLVLVLTIVLLGVGLFARVRNGARSDRRRQNVV